MSNVIALKPRAVPAALTALDEVAAAAARLDACGPVAASWRRFIDAAVFPAGSHPGGPCLDGDGCLAHLLELPVKGFGRLWEAAAAHWSGQPGARGAAKAAGVLFDPADLPGWAAVANKTPDLVRHFHGTAWAAGWNRALASLEGAARTDRVFWFTDRPSRAILLPRALFNPGE